jgi:hypothetical protein
MSGLIVAGGCSPLEEYGCAGDDGKTARAALLWTAATLTLTNAAGTVVYQALDHRLAYRRHHRDHVKEAKAYCAGTLNPPLRRAVETGPLLPIYRCTGDDGRHAEASRSVLHGVRVSFSDETSSKGVVDYEQARTAAIRFCAGLDRQPGLGD